MAPPAVNAIIRDTLGHAAVKAILYGYACPSHDPRLGPPAGDGIPRDTLGHSTVNAIIRYTRVLIERMLVVE